MKRNTYKRDFSSLLDGLAANTHIPHSTGRVDRVSCSGDASGPPFYHWRWKYKVLPDVVIWPRNVDDVQRVMKLATTYSIPVTPRGGGTCYTSSSVPAKGGILLDMKRLDGIKLQLEERRVVVQAGATFGKVNEYLHKQGLSLPTWPTSAMGATIGGWISTGGQVGFGTARYGGFTSQVQEIEVISLPGKVRRIVKPEQIARYFGTCGTLGIILSASITVVSEERPSTSCFSFQSHADIQSAISGILRAELKPLFLRFTDQLQDRLSRAEHKAPWTLLVSHDSDPQAITEIVASHHGKFLGADASRQYGEGLLFHEALPKARVPVLMLQQLLLPLDSCFDLIEAGRKLASDLQLPFTCAATVASIDRVRLVIEVPADNEHWNQFMSSKALLHELVKKAYHGGYGRAYTYGMLNAMYMVRFKRDAAKEWLLTKGRIDPKGVLNPFKYGSSKMSYLRIDVLFRINIAWRRLKVLASRRSAVLDPGDSYRGVLNSPLKQCAQCAACRDACPVYSAMQNESVYPGGRYRATMAVEQQVVARDADFPNNLLACTTCGACKASCPLEIDHAAFIIDRRTQNAATDGNANEKHEAMRESYIREGNVYGEPHDHRSDWMRGDEASHFHIVERGDIAYFVGCTAAFRSRDTAVSAMKILSRMIPDGIVILGNEEECCGGPLVRAGQEHRAGVAARVREMVQRFVLRGVKRIIFSCPGCYSSAIDFWPRMLGARLPFEVMHIVEFVAAEVRAGRVQFKEHPVDVTYHDPCHLGRQLGIFDAPREILAAIPGVHLVEMEHNREQAACCGAGGAMRAALPDVASTIASRRIEEAVRTKASTIVTSCVFCEQAIQMAIEAHSVSMSCIDIVKLLSLELLPIDREKQGGGSK